VSPRRALLRLACTAIAAFALAVAAPSPAAAEPGDGELVWIGVGLALPTYAIGVTLHEGSHAVAAKLLGADVLSIDLLPGRDPNTGAFHFGLTRVRGLTSPSQKAFFYLAPKLTDTLLLGGFTGLVFTDAWPDNRYGQLALTVLATGFWIDFTKDVLSFSPNNDVVKVMHLAGLTTEWKKLPARLGYATISVTLAFALVRGYQRTFEDPENPEPAVRFAPRQLVLPLLRGAF
jgi:hypothetical protein